MGVVRAFVSPVRPMSWPLGRAGNNRSRGWLLAEWTCSAVRAVPGWRASPSMRRVRLGVVGPNGQEPVAANGGPTSSGKQHHPAHPVPATAYVDALRLRLPGTTLGSPWRAQPSQDPGLCRALAGGRNGGADGAAARGRERGGRLRSAAGGRRDRPSCDRRPGWTSRSGVRVRLTTARRQGWETWCYESHRCRRWRSSTRVAGPRWR